MTTTTRRDATGEGRPPLAIVGPTASGKSELAVTVAARVPGAEIVSADAMAVYRMMDIGTAKPDTTTRHRVPHHLVDVVDPWDDYTLSRFTTDATSAIADVTGRGGSVVLVGGTGLYVHAVVDDLQIPPRFPDLRAELEAEAIDAPSIERMWLRLRDLDPDAAARMEPTNDRRIVRALEVTLGSGRPFSSYGPGIAAFPPTDTVLVGLEIERDQLDRRIADRYRAQVDAGFVEEVETLLALEPPWSATARQALGYDELARHLAGELSLEEAIDDAIRRTRRFARRQQRWFRRDPRIRWVPFDAPDLVDQVETWWGESLR